MSTELQKLLLALLDCAELNQDELEVETQILLQHIAAVQDFERQLNLMSGFNAAEGRDYSRETSAREKCRAQLNLAGKKLLQLEIDPDQIIKQGSYLVDDWR